MERQISARGARLVLRLLTCVVAAWSTLASVPAGAQRGGPPPGPPPSGQAGAPIDVTGVWVSVVNEDWRHRMMTPPKGDYESVPLNAAGRARADQWDPQADIAAGMQCKAYGAPGVTRLPGRMRIGWRDEYTLEVEFDNGTQTRLLHFARPQESGPPMAPPPEAAPSLLGHSVVQWQKQAQSRGLFARGGLTAARPGSGGALHVTTTNLEAGYLRKNGVPYSADANLTEYFDRFDLPGGAPWLLLTTIVDDPAYLSQPFIVSSQFKKEQDGSKWNPVPCSAQ